MQENFVCECGREFEEYSSYRAHRWRCPIGKEYYKQEKDQINQLNKEIFYINADGLYECKCGMTFKNKSNYSYHIKHCEYAKDIYEKYLELQNKIEKNIESKYICDTCGQSFKTLLGLDIHCRHTNHKHSFISIQKQNKLNSKGHIQFIKQCTICNQIFKTWEELHKHYVQEHNYKFINTFDFIVKYKNFISKNLDIPKCKYCNKNDIDCRSRRLTNHCGDEKCLYMYRSEQQKLIYKNNPQLAINARKRRIEYLSNKDNFEKTAYGKRANRQYSFLEQWFIDKVIKQYNLDKQFLIINEYAIGAKSKAYVLDFAFKDIKLDVELDGRCHFNNGNQRIEHDIERDKYLLNKGWKIYRISYKDVELNEEETINQFINNLNSNNFIYNDTYYTDLLTYKEYKEQIIKKELEKKKEKRLKKKQEHANNIRNIFIDLEQNSNIDFSKFGWGSKALKYVQSKGYNCARVLKQINKYYPEFFEHNDIFIR